MQADTAADQLGREQVAFEGLADEEDGRDDGDARPVVELHPGHADRGDETHGRADEGHEGQQPGDQPDDQPEVEAGNAQGGGIEDRQHGADRGLATHEAGQTSHRLLKRLPLISNGWDK